MLKLWIMLAGMRSIHTIPFPFAANGMLLPCYCQPTRGILSLPWRVTTSLGTSLMYNSTKRSTVPRPYCICRAWVNLVGFRNPCWNVGRANQIIDRGIIAQPVIRVAWYPVHRHQTLPPCICAGRVWVRDYTKSVFIWVGVCQLCKHNFSHNQSIFALKIMREYSKKNEKCRILCNSVA